MKRILPLVAATILLLIGSSLLLAEEPPKPAAVLAPPPAERAIDLVICLDTSNSMDGLIESAKQKLWAVVNELATAQPKPALRVALYQYGNDGLNSQTGWVQQVCELTDDLDTVYGRLFALRTHGGTEYVARVVRAATHDLKWSEQKDALKIIVVAGNEPATQDTQYKLEEICKAAITRGIIVNAIYCGAESEGRNSGWADAARWADGRFAAIDQNSGTVAIATPFDQPLADLGAELNSTYLAYGPRGAAGAANQAAQDRNALSVAAPAAAQRSISKASGLYHNSSWDLVDAAKAKDFKIEQLAEAELPAEMQKMTPEERKAHIAQQTAKREQIQAKIKELAAQRDAAVKQEMARRNLDETSAFDAVLRSAVREQAEKRGFQFQAAQGPQQQPAAK